MSLHMFCYLYVSRDSNAVRRLGAFLFYFGAKMVLIWLQHCRLLLCSVKFYQAGPFFVLRHDGIDLVKTVFAHPTDAVVFQWYMDFWSNLSIDRYTLLPALAENGLGIT